MRTNEFDCVCGWHGRVEDMVRQTIRMDVGFCETFYMCPECGLESSVSEGMKEEQE